MKSVFELLWADADSIGPRILTFTTEPVSDTKAKELVVLTGQYNDFVPDRVCRAIDACPPGCKFEIGREYSPVIYVECSCLDDQQRRRVVTLFEQASADEVEDEVDGHLPFRLRFWWD